MDSDPNNQTRNLLTIQNKKQNNQKPNNHLKIPKSQNLNNIFNKQNKQKKKKVEGPENTGSYKFVDNRQPETKANCANNKHSLVVSNSPSDRPEHPPNPFGKTLIELELVLSKLYDLDLDINKFTARGSMAVVWCDPRLKFDKEYGEQKEIFDSGADIALKQGLIWTPEIRIRNGFRVRDSDNIRIYNFQDGTMLQREKFTVETQANFDLTKIPFDTQFINLNVGSLTYDDDYIQILEDESSVRVTEDFNMPEFHVKNTQYKVLQYVDPVDGKVFSYLQADFALTRQSANIILKIVVPIQFLIILSSLVFSQPNDQFANRISILLNCIFATIAYQLVVESRIPKFLFMNCLNLAVFCAILVMAFGFILSWMLMQLDEMGQQFAANKIASFYILWQNAIYGFILIDIQLCLVLELPSYGMLSIFWVILCIAYLIQTLNQNNKGPEGLLKEPEKKEEKNNNNIKENN